MKITGLVSIATLSVTLAAGAVYAESTSVSRCNSGQGAEFKPSLWITQNGVSRLVKVGEEGLTRRIVFDDQLAIAYVRAQNGGGAGSSHVSMTNACSTSTYSYAAEKDVVIAENEVLPVECGPALCGPTDCGPMLCGPTDCGPSYCGPTDCGPAYCGPTDCGPSYCGPSYCGPSYCGPFE